MEDRLNILLVDDQPGKLLSYEVVLKELNQNLIKASSAKEAFTHLLRNEIAVILIDVVMPEMDGFELAGMIREHPRFRETAIIFISAIQLSEQDRVRGYEMGAVDYVPVPVVPEVLRAKVKIFCDLYRKTRQLETLNRDLEARVKERTRALQKAHAELVQSERWRGVALSAGKMGSWVWNILEKTISLDAAQYEVFGVETGGQTISSELGTIGLRKYLDADDVRAAAEVFERLSKQGGTHQMEIRIRRPDGERRWCLVSATADRDAEGSVARIAGVTLDITDRKRAEETQLLLAKEVDHRARNTLAVVQAVIRMTRAGSISDYITLVEGRISALARAHGLLSASRWQGADLRRLVEDELAPFKTGTEGRVTIEGPVTLLTPAMAQSVAMALHELTTNAAKYGALARPESSLAVKWAKSGDKLLLTWTEAGLTGVVAPRAPGFGSNVIKATVKEQLRGMVTLDWRPTGLVCSMEIPDSVSRAAASDAPVRASPNGSTDVTRVLVAEDEALVGLMMRAALSDAGYHVVGPFSSVEEAMKSLPVEKFDCAVLDVNLTDGPVYPLAAALVDANIPFVFATGYDVRSIDERFKGVPVIQKPADRNSLLATLPPPKTKSEKRQAS